MKAKQTIRAIFSNAIAWIISAICLIPLLLIIFNSVKDKLAASDMNLKLPDFPLAWENFTTVIEKGKLMTSFLNSLTYSVGSVFLCVIFASLAAYVLSRNASKLNGILYMFLVLGITMPINYVALTKVMVFLHLNNTKLGIILLYTAMQLPFSVFLLHGFVARIPTDLDEAAVIDGCGPARLFFTIIMPLLKPALATVVVLTFLNTWNEFVSPLYFLSSSEKWPMPLSVYNFFGMYYKDWNLVCADILLTSLPVIIVYLLGQKYIVSGMTAGAVKG
ncbi:carbohydrate ABC transporter permease [Waltera sp.]|jgi:raffinose/stachyose/melibiose transport system permease protein|uniref:carbohydrate ABC transporter permease n=1 Tax=Waltera sp. TaxID=2815806 RepID=UPI003AB8D083